MVANLPFDDTGSCAVPIDVTKKMHINTMFMNMFGIGKNLYILNYHLTFNAWLLRSVH
jgi:hypothetical protein